MAVTEFSAALNQVATERGIPVESVLESIRVALASAYKRDRKDVGEDVEIEDITVDLNTDTGEVRIIKDKKDVTPAGFGRIAAQTAKQVILQKIRETEKDVIIEEYKSKLGTIMSGTVFRIENGVIILDLGKAHGILPQSEQVEAEQYRLNQRLKVFIKDIKETEIASGVVRIEAMAREAGSRTKMAVSSSDEKVDPVGSCVGQKGVRVQSIISEVFGEKIDIIPYSSSPEKFVAASLSPARVTEVELDHDERKATVSVPEDQQSLAIGKEGQNARLANKLTKWKIDIKGAPGLFGTVAEAAEVAKGKKIIRGIWDEDIKKAEDLLDEEAEKLAENVAEEIEVAGENTDVPEEKSEQKEPDAKE